MRIKFIAILMGGVILSTVAAAVVPKETPSPMLSNKVSQYDQHLKNLKSIHHHNMIFDDYSSGSTPYEPYKK